LLAVVGKVGLAGKILRHHGGAGVGGVAEALVGAEVLVAGGLAVIGSVGKYSEPCCPQADRFATPTPMAIVLTRI
jgi:hypothetical protein